MSTTAKPLVLVTGGTGFIGSHIIAQLLDDGYRVRAAARPGKTASLKATYPKAGDKLEVIEIADVATSDFTEAFKGVGALIHTAAATYIGNRPSREEIFKSAVEGALNVVNAAIKAGVKKIVYTSTGATALDLDFKNAFGTELIDVTAWPNVTVKDIDIEKNPDAIVYMTSKAVAEKDFWETAKQHPDIDFTAILPGAVYGPYVAHYPPAKTREGLGTNESIYSLIAGGPDGPNTYPDGVISWWSHVAHVARAHIIALTSPPLKDGRQKRLFAIPGRFTWTEAAELIKKKRPELVSRLPDAKAIAPAQTTADYNTQLTTEVLGRNILSGTTWQATVLEALDAVLAWEKTLN